ncbi:MAG: inositol monophosphatase [Pseudomonadales bacterium]
MTYQLDEKLNTAKGIIREAGGIALDYFRSLDSLTVSSKGVQDMVTEADVNVERFIIDQLHRRYPEHLILGEESCQNFVLSGQDKVWVIDPIDGTQPFISSIPSWCISLSFVDHCTTKIGIVYDPLHDEMFVAGHGYGAYLNDRRILTSTESSVANGLVGIGHSNRVTVDDTLGPMTRLLENNGMFHRCGSGALSLAWVASGRLLGYFEPHMCSWDALAGLLLVKEANGDHLPYLTSREALIKGNRVLASGSLVYDSLCKIIL